MNSNPCGVYRNVEEGLWCHMTHEVCFWREKEEPSVFQGEDLSEEVDGLVLVCKRDVQRYK